MEKTHLYFVPGLAANTKIFENISINKDVFELHFLNWILPISIEETIQSYAQRMCEYIKYKNSVIIGVSFGGVIVQEMSKIISFKKTIIISSVKSNQEFSCQLKIAQKTKLYKLFPVKIIQNIEKYECCFLGKYLKKRIALYRLYLSVRNYNYLYWSINNMLNWKQNKPLNYVYHIHGDKDEIFPIKYIKNCIEIKNGTHIMILNKANIISKTIENICLNTN